MNHQSMMHPGGALTPHSPWASLNLPETRSDVSECQVQVWPIEVFCILMLSSLKMIVSISQSTAIKDQRYIAGSTQRHGP